MFGYVQTFAGALSERDNARYEAVYCGLCRTLGRRYGWLARFSLTYDMTFLILLLSSLYEPDEALYLFHCALHPWKKSWCAVSDISEYAADMTALLAYHKCLDDWRDSRKQLSLWYAKRLESRYETAKALWPKQAEAVERGLAELAEVETSEDSAPDAASNCFGRLLSSVFLYKRDRWQEDLTAFGYGLGQFIYMMDAVIDCEEDQKNGNYNPVLMLNRSPEEMREPLMLLIGRASEAFERLPLVQDGQILRNILYSGVWQQYNQVLQKQKEGKRNG